ncbi:glycosyltransferase family 2 protein [uncultured Pedobacter sp.]|uniref:glycosyltransferase family 2 protein n=1 Tax=uncultured Pedobacter sp. TaxID=246139 RepID=UPI0025DAF706|nr:glycosyltransferase family 2 protein [uncultured Pedobacter sp.]
MYFSCIVTCYNREKEIARSIQSILDQTFQNFEILLIDDCSTDHSVKIVESFNSSKIRIIHHEFNKGQNAALNTGVNNASYDFLAFLDSDDTWLPNYLQEMQQTYLKHPDAAFAYCSLVNGPIWTLEGADKYPDILNQGFLSSMISITARKSVVKGINGFDLRYKICQDDDFCFRLAKNHSFKVIKKQLAHVHGATNSMTKNQTEVAKGWDFLFDDYKKDILVFCGARTYARHMLNVSMQYFNCNEMIAGFKCYVKGVYFFLRPSNNLFPFTVKEFFVINKKLFSIFLRKIKRIFIK